MFPDANLRLEIEVNFYDLFLLLMNGNNGYNPPCFDWSVTQKSKW